MGRKLKLTPQTQEEIVRALGVGATHEQACQYVGITPECFYNWLRHGEAGRSPYSEFFQAVKKAEGQAAIGWLASIEAAARAGQWQAAAWKLERRYPKAWGKQVAELDLQNMPDIHVHVHTARERLGERLSHLAMRHAQDAPETDA